MPDRADRRQLARYLIQLPLLHKPRGPAPARAGVGWSRNLSEEGVCAELAEPLAPQAPLEVRLQTDRGLIEVGAEVVWTGAPAPAGGGVLHGVAFTEIARDQRELLRDLILSKGLARQAGVRVPLDLPVTCQPQGQPGPPLQGRTGDMSRGGLLLHLPRVLSPGTGLEITLHAPYGPLTAEGTVVWVEPTERRTPEAPIRHGLQFTTIGWSTSLSLGLLLVEPLWGPFPPSGLG